jgi:photosystem II stability/assembly factor-like uncharacterized protein
MRFPILVKPLTRILLVLSLTATVSGLNSSPAVQAQGQAEANLRQFDRLSANTGWVLLGSHLFWTSDTGQTWKEIGPSFVPDASVEDVQFIDAQTGWMLWTTIEPGGAAFHLHHTTDGGKTWMTHSLSLFESGETGSYAERAEMGWFDTQTGWIAVKQISGSNFSIGALFRTSDGGDHWNRSVLPVADHIYFNDPQRGWAIGGATNDRVFSTQDAGATWKDDGPSDITKDRQAVAYPPFVSGTQGVLVVTTQAPENALKVFSLEASGSWSSFGQVKLDVQPGRIGVSILDAQNFVATIPGKRSIVRMAGGILEVLNNQDGLSGSISELDMVSLDAGWAKSIDASCTESPVPDEGTVSCSSSTRLLQTTDGGMTWQRLNLPIIHSDIAPSPAPDEGIAPATSDIPMLENTEVFIGQGFDKCEIPSLSQMRTWWDASPYKAVNLYIGGSSRACWNDALTSSYLSRLYQQGWKFIPTWVGPQAPCTGYPSRMSSDVTLAYGQGVNEANLAVERLAALGLTDIDKTGSVVYYDIEPYGTNTTCRAAVNAFMNGWVSQLHARGNLAGVYGSTLCNTGLSDLRSITNVPDVIWPARWYHNLGQGYYDPDANVWNLGSCIPNTAWSNHQRVRQYEGDHDELWGGLMLAIDSNVLDGVVAIPRTTTVQVNIKENVQGMYKLVPNQITHQSYASVDNGPVQIISTSNSLVASERVIYNVNGVDTSFLEMMALPNSQLDTTYWLPWYNNKDLNTQLRFANVGSSTATVHVSIGGVEMTGSPFTLPAGASTRKSFTGVDRGPVKIESNVDIVASERVIYNVNAVDTSFSEMMALPARQLDTIYWLPWYNNKDLDTQLRFANVSDTEARVHVTIGGVPMAGSPFTLGPGRSMRKSFPGVDKGPVRIESNVPIVAAERVIYRVNGLPTSFSEMMALPARQLDTIYWLPWYNNKDLDTQLRLANVSGTTAAVRVYIDGQEMTGSPFTLAPGASIRRSFAGIDRGPVQIVSNTNIVAAERVIYRVNGMPTSFSEMMGLPDRLLDTTYWLPWYNNVDLDTQLRFGLP